MISRVAVLTLVVAGVVNAQQTSDTARVAPIIVSATRAPMSASTLPVAVTVVTSDELQLRGITTVSEALREVTSAYIAQSGSQGAQTSLFLRGGESKYVKVLIDGVPVNDPGGAYDFASLTTDNVDRIEIVRGPVSVIHGADAVTGVVNVVTRRGTASRVDADLRMGTMPRDARAGASDRATQTVDATVGAFGLTSSGSYSLALARHGTDGLYVVNNAYASTVVSGAFDLAPSAVTRLSITGRYVDYKYRYPTNSGGAITDNNAYRTEDRTALGAVVERQLSAAHRLVLALNLSESDGGTDDQMDGTGGSSYVSLERTRRRGIEVRSHSLPSRWATLTTGLQLEQQDQRTQYQSDGPFGPYNDRFAATRLNVALFAELVGAPSETFTFTAGIRADSNEQFGTFVTGRAGVSWRATSGTRLRATAGTAFREPTFAENFATGFVQGNPDLHPEHTRTFDAGIDHDVAGGRARASVTGFAQRFQNMIDYDATTAACNYSYCNVAVATANGVELEFGARIVDGLWATVDATLLQTNVEEPGFDVTSGALYKKGEALIRRPERNVGAELTYRGRGPLSASLRAMAVGIRHDRDFRSFPSTPVVLPSYERLDLGAEYVIPVRNTRRSALTLRIENLTNISYENIFNFLTPRRTITLGARSSF
jgi:vitamin B12 transporter